MPFKSLLTDTLNAKDPSSNGLIVFGITLVVVGFMLIGLPLPS
jgi:hypothetical protein